MTIPVRVEQQNGAFTASVLGSPQLSATGQTGEAAVTALRSVLVPQVMSGELAFLDIDPRGLTALANTRFKDDPGWREAWDEIVTEVYRYRDELKKQEFPE